MPVKSYCGISTLKFILLCLYRNFPALKYNFPHKNNILYYFEHSHSYNTIILFIKYYMNVTSCLNKIIFVLYNIHLFMAILYLNTSAAIICDLIIELNMSMLHIIFEDYLWILYIVLTLHMCLQCIIEEGKGTNYRWLWATIMLLLWKRSQCF